MARAYATFANGGYLVEPNIVKEVRNLAGETIYKARYPVVCPECPQPETAPSSDRRGDARGSSHQSGRADSGASRASTKATLSS